MLLFDVGEPPPPSEDELNPNPMVKKHGRTIGEKCKTCDYLCWHQRSKRWYKCELRGITSGAGTDHRVSWDACGLYEREESE